MRKMAYSKANISWGCCDIDREDSDFIVCKSCAKGFHIECIVPPGTSMPKELFLSPEWLCPLCAPKRKRNNKDDTLLRSKSSTARPQKRVALNSPPQSSTEIETLTRRNVREVIQELFKNEMDNLLCRLSDQIKITLSTELTPIKNDVQDLKTSMSLISEQYNIVLQKQIQLVEDIKDLQTQNLSLRTANVELTARLNQLEQHTRSCNVEIQCIPENKNENVITMVTELGKIIRCQIKEENILSCSRIAKMNPKTSRPRSIVVQFNSPRQRDVFLAASIKFNRSHPSDKLNSSHIGISGNKTPIYVLEHLSSSNKALHAAARMAAKEYGYKYVWVRNGRVFMRKTDTSDHKLIRDVETLHKIALESIK